MEIEVLKPGLATSIQDHPGRVGHLSLGFPPSGPLDSWSFRLANLLVGNAPGAPALEFQFIGPTLRFREPMVIAVCGADLQARLNGAPLPLWTSVFVKKNDVFETGAALAGARGYLAVEGAFAIEAFLGSCSTFSKARVGGYLGRTLVAGDVLITLPGNGLPGCIVHPPARPEIDRTRRWTVEVTAGPHDHWLGLDGQKTFLDTSWKLSAKSDRTGFRLESKSISFSDFARNKPPENGSDPSNIIDYGYPIGGINLSGETPIILVNDALTMGGFICPYTVPSAAFWRLAQARPGNELRFRLVDVEEAHKMRRTLDGFCTPANISRNPTVV